MTESSGIHEIINSAQKMLKTNAPAILTSIGVGGVIATGFLSAKAGMRTVRRLESEDPAMPIKEKVAKVWDLYVPPVSVATVSVTAILCANRANAQRTAAALTAYSIVEKGFADYKDKVVQTIGEHKATGIRDAVVQDKIDKNPPTSSVIVTGAGDVLCLELHTGRYFNSSMEALRRAENEIGQEINRELYVTLDSFYYKVGLPTTTSSNHLGWDSDHGLMELMFTSALTPTGEPCLAFDYDYLRPI